MGCDAGRACIHDHVWPYLRDPKPGSEPDSYRALAPCHPDQTHGLSVSTGGSGRVIWHCFACRDSEKTRAALIKVGVPARCLRRPADEAAASEDVISGIVFGVDSHAHKVLRLAAYLRGYGHELPGGAELRALAEDCGISLREAYKARGHFNR
jgi:hypothetical protein